VFLACTRAFSSEIRSFLDRLAANLYLSRMSIRPILTAPDPRL